MPRLVVPKSSSGRLATANLSDLPPDGYGERILKYIPAESVAFYLCVDKLIANQFHLEHYTAGNASPHGDGILFLVLSWLVFLVALIGTPLYLRNRRLPKQPWILHATVSTVAFCCWAYSIGGSLFVLYCKYNDVVAALTAPIFAFIAGVFEPGIRTTLEVERGERNGDI